jgi:mannose-6-phosphate isomerase-like protein (cupin superfamily)
MTRTASEMAREVRERMRGGDGSVEILHVFRAEELRGTVRLVARLRLQAGCSIGWHVHEKEEEIFYILSGSGTVNDDGKTVSVGAGDAVLTGGGAGHAIANPGPAPLELMAVILPF